MAIALVQHKLSSVTSAGANAVSFTSTPTAGNLIVVAITYFNGGTDNFSSLGDNQSGNTYTQVGSTRITGDGQNHCRLYYAKNVNSTGTFTVTASYTGSPGAGDTNIAIYEYSGADTTAPLDSSNPGGTGNSATVSPGAVTPTVNGCLIFSVGADDNGNNATPTANTGESYVLEDHQDDSTSHERFYTEDRVQTTAASTTASFTIGVASNYVVQAGVFKPATLTATGNFFAFFRP